MGRCIIICEGSMLWYVFKSLYSLFFLQLKSYIVYEFAAPFYKQAGDGSVHHCAHDQLDPGACPKVSLCIICHAIMQMHHLLTISVFYNLFTVPKRLW